MALKTTKKEYNLYLIGANQYHFAGKIHRRNGKPVTFSEEQATHLLQQRTGGTESMKIWGVEAPKTTMEEEMDVSGDLKSAEVVGTTGSKAAPASGGREEV